MLISRWQRVDQWHDTIGPVWGLGAADDSQALPGPVELRVVEFMCATTRRTLPNAFAIGSQTS